MVASALRSIGYDPVVVGGSAATLHTAGTYCSLDIDMVIVGGIDRARDVINIMSDLGFTLTNTMFVHSASIYTVDFVPSPVAIGEEVISDFATIKTDFGNVLVLHATDAACDRLNKYAAWHDNDSFETAVAIAKAADVDLERIKAFMKRHSRTIPNDEFESALKRFLDRVEERPRIHEYEFWTTISASFIEAPQHQVAETTAIAIRHFLDSGRSSITGLHAVGSSGTITLDGRLSCIPLNLSTLRKLPYVEQFQIAIDAVRFLSENVHCFPLIDYFVKDDAPSIAS